MRLIKYQLRLRYRRTKLTSILWSRLRNLISVTTANSRKWLKSDSTMASHCPKTVKAASTRLKIAVRSEEMPTAWFSASNPMIWRRNGCEIINFCSIWRQVGCKSMLRTPRTVPAPKLKKAKWLGVAQSNKSRLIASGRPLFLMRRGWSLTWTNLSNLGIIQSLIYWLHMLNSIRS